MEICFCKYKKYSENVILSIGTYCIQEKGPKLVFQLRKIITSPIFQPMCFLLQKENEIRYLTLIRWELDFKIHLFSQRFDTMMPHMLEYYMSEG